MSDEKLARAEHALRTAAWQLPVGFDSAKHAQFSAADAMRDARDELAELRARVAELEAAANTMRSTFDALIGSGNTTATLTPRKCAMQCIKSAEEMREWAADTAFDAVFSLCNAVDARKVSAAIRALQPKSCDCNPLAPE